MSSLNPKRFLVSKVVSDLFRMPIPLCIVKSFFGEILNTIPSLSLSDIKNVSDHLITLNFDQCHEYDLNTIMLECDILINDYSTTSTDFAILRRPQIFIMNDIEEYLQYDSLIGDYINEIPGVEAKDFNELIFLIEHKLKNGASEKDNILIDKYLDKYYKPNADSILCADAIKGTD